MNILITGGSGLVGRRLTAILQESGHQVSWLVRTSAFAGIKTYRWLPEKQQIDHAAFENAEVLIHLAGENVGAKRWTKKRKKQILESRIVGTSFLTTILKTVPNKIKTVICASAIGIYGNGDKHQIFHEDSDEGSGFLAQVTKQWEQESMKFQKGDVRLVLLRIGVVLSAQGGAIPQLAKPIKFFVGAPLGSGKQMMSWIHIDDLCRMILTAVTDERILGVYNAVSPNPVNNAGMTKSIAQYLNRRVILPAVPAFVLKLVLGDMAEMILEGANVSSHKIEQAGFKFSYPDLDSALKNILK